MTVYYYILHGIKYGSINKQKIEFMSKRDGDGKVYSTDISNFTGQLLSSEWN